MRTPLVSIGIPTFNRPQQLERIIQIAREQTYRNLDIVIIDNCSTMCEVSQVITSALNSDKRVRSFRNETNVGVLKNAKLTLDAAQGEYFCWFSDDDWRAPEFIETLVNHLEHKPDALMAFCDYREITDDLHLAQGYPSSHGKGLQKFTNDSPILRTLRYYWQDQKDGKCNIFYSVYRRSGLLQLNLEKLSQGYTQLSMDNYIAMSMVQKSKLVFHNDVLCALTCRNEKQYFNQPTYQKITPTIGRKFAGFLKASFDDLKMSKQIVENFSARSLLIFMFLPKLVKETTVRAFRKMIPIVVQNRKDEIAIQKIFEAENLKKLPCGGMVVQKHIHIPNVTLIAVATKDVEKTAMALRYSKTAVKFGAVKLLSHYKPWNLGDKIDHVRIRPFKSVDDWGKFIIYDLVHYIETDFIMLVHADGFVVNPDVWDPNFLRYDYIGSPWPVPKDPISYRDECGTLYRVGNSVSIRSKKLLKIPSDINLPWEPFHGLYNEDGFLCVKHRKSLEKQGIRFAELHDAKYFAHERMLPETHNIKSFAFHKWKGTNANYPEFRKY